MLQGLTDPDQHVRGAAAFALGQFSEHLAPEVLEHYETVLPALFAAMRGAAPWMQVTDSGVSAHSRARTITQPAS